MEKSDYQSTPFGEARRTPGRHGYVAYHPSPIPRAVELPGATVRLLADAEAALGRLAGVAGLVPNPHLLIRPYLLREALFSTRIEGTQASLADVLEVEIGDEPPNADVEEVVNYIAALEWGLAHVRELPLGVRLIREMHRRLLAGVRGRERVPGEFRTTQNWVGGGGSTVATARFVPPPPEELPGLLADWERYAHEEDAATPLLVRHALLHYQFETLHPFLDGNGRIGRLLSVFLLVEHERLPAPLLYLSAYLERDRTRYYEALQGVRERGEASAWIDLFLTAIRTQAQDAVQRAQRIVELREQYRAAAAGVASRNATALVELACETPILSARSVETALGVTRPTALALLSQLEAAGVLRQSEAGPRGQRRYVAHELMAALTAEELPAAALPATPPSSGPARAPSVASAAAS